MSPIKNGDGRRVNQCSMWLKQCPWHHLKMYPSTPFSCPYSVFEAKDSQNPPGSKLTQMFNLLARIHMCHLYVAGKKFISQSIFNHAFWLIYFSLTRSVVDAWINIMNMISCSRWHLIFNILALPQIPICIYNQIN